MYQNLLFNMDLKLTSKGEFLHLPANVWLFYFQMEILFVYFLMKWNDLEHPFNDSIILCSPARLHDVILCLIHTHNYSEKISLQIILEPSI